MAYAPTRDGNGRGIDCGRVVKIHVHATIPVFVVLSGYAPPSHIKNPRTHTQIPQKAAPVVLTRSEMRACATIETRIAPSTAMYHAKENHDV